jgi:hypothetical protein
MRSRFLRDEINFENLVYKSFNDQVQDFLKLCLNGLKRALNDFSRLIITNEKIKDKLMFIKTSTQHMQPTHLSTKKVGSSAIYEVPKY